MLCLLRENKRTHTHMCTPGCHKQGNFSVLFKWLLSAQVCSDTVTFSGRINPPGVKSCHL